MDAARHERATEVFLGTVRLEPEERDAYVTQACGDDARLLAEVRALLAHDRVDEQEPRLDLARRLLTELGHDDDGTLPERIDGYRVLGLLGHGGSSVVLRARQEGTGREVALKLLRHGADDAALTRRLALEAHLLGMLDHPGIARVLESGSYPTPEGPRPYLAMELVHGKPLTEHCREHRLDTRERLELLAQVADAVQHAHHCGVIHRDLKPGNILVSEDGRPKVLDFGIARALQADGAPTPRDTDLPVLGTLGYMSPEQLTGDARRVDMRSDVYALGVIAYELLAGRAPFDTSGANVQEVLERLARSDPVPLGQVAPRLRGDLEAVVGKAMARDRTRRYGSAAALAGDLRRYLARRPVSARRPGVARRTAHVVRRHPLATVALAGLILTLSVFLWAKQQALVENRREIDRFERLFEDLAVFLNDPHADDEGEVVALDEGTLREKLANAGGYIRRRLADQPDTAGSLHVLIGRLLKGHGTTPEEADAVRGHFERGVELLDAALGREHPSTLQARRDLATHLVDRWDLDDAATVLAELESDGAERLDDDPRLAVQVMSIRARLHRIRGEMHAARRVQADALERARDHFGVQHLQTLAALVRLLGLLPPAEGLALVDAERARLPDPLRPRLALRFDRAEAQLLQDRGLAHDDPHDLARAVTLLEQHRDQCAELLGEDSRTVFMAEVLLGGALLASGRLDAATPLLERLHAESGARLAHDDPLLQRLRLLLARALRESGRLADARAVCAELTAELDAAEAPTIGDGEVLLEAARCALARGDAAAAERLVARTRALWAPTMDRDHGLWRELEELLGRIPRAP